ncbi:ORF1 [Carrot closterovirus 1]|uniref:ORF1 n=1 Tax=Carrot closterovirus 1 TaxID=2843916 RepID=A0A0A0P6V8_9CLOS|nr:ORF1 [Carrot closterovirus]AHA85409.1 ORF1 [Carrot closterovirus 1]
MALTCYSVRALVATSLTRDYPSVFNTSVPFSPGFSHVFMDNKSEKTSLKLAEAGVLKRFSAGASLSILCGAFCASPKSPVARARALSVSEPLYASRDLPGSPIFFSPLPFDFRQTAEIFNLKRKFTNKNKTKIMLLSKDGRHRLFLPFRWVKAAKGTPFTATSSDGRRYSFRATGRKARKASRKSHIPEAPPVSQKYKLRAIKEKRNVKAKREKRGSPFTAKTVSFETPPITDIAPVTFSPPNEPARVRRIPWKEFHSEKPYSSIGGFVSVIGSKLGMHVNLRGDATSLMDTVLDYLHNYVPERDDFIVSFSINGKVFLIRLRGCGKVEIRSDCSKLVISTSASAEYLAVTRMRKGAYLRKSIASRYTAPRGRCYLNHVWFLCLRAGCAFWPAMKFFSRLGLNPLASDFSFYVSAYFGCAASKLFIAGRYTGFNKFHCDNSSRRLYSLSYLRNANVGAEGENTENKTVALTDVGRVKALTQVHESLRANRESLLVKNMEIDLVNFLNTTKNLEKGKEKVFVPFMLTEVQQSRIIQDYPHFSIVFSNSSASDHPMAAASRLLENRTVASFCSDHFIDVGGCPLHHYYHSKTKRVHVCRPVYDSKDAQRRVLRNVQLKSPLKRVLGESDEADVPYVPSTHTSCAKVLRQCTYSADYMVMVQVYDITLEDLCGSMENRGISVCYLTMITPGEILDRREAFHHNILNCDIAIDSGANTITYKFGSSCYTHALSTVAAYMTTPVYVTERSLFSIEMTGQRCGVNYYVITKSEVSPAMNCQKVIRYRRCCEGLVRVKLPKFCKKTRKCLPGVDYVFVDSDFVERIHQYVIGNCSVVNSKTFEWVWNYVKSSKSRVVISGKMIQRDVTISLDQMEPMVVVMLAAGVRSRQASEYLAKNVALYTGKASIIDILLFSLKEKYNALRQSLNAYLTKALKDFFSDALLMEFLDLDDAFTYYDDYSEVTVDVKQQGFGTISNDEIQELIEERCTSDIISSTVVKALTPPPKKASKSKGGELKDKHGRDIGLYAASNRKSVFSALFTLLDACRDVLGGALLRVLSSLSGVFSRLAKDLGSFGLKLKLLYDSTMSFVNALSLAPAKALELISSTLRHYALSDCSFAKSFTRMVGSCFSGVRASGNKILEILHSYVCTVRSVANSCHSVTLRLVESYISELRSATHFDLHECLGFEAAVAIVNRFVLDLPLVLTGRVSPSQCVINCLSSLVMEVNLNILIAKAMGPVDTLKKDMFCRAVSSLTASSYFSPFTFSVETFFRLSTLLPMIIRKLIVSFFSDGFSFYVGQVKYGVEDLSALIYARRACSEFCESVSSGLNLRFERFMERHVELACNSIAQKFSDSVAKNKFVAASSAIVEGVRTRYRSLKKNVKVACRLEELVSDGYESAAEDFDMLSDEPLVRGGSSHCGLVSTCFALFSRMKRFLLSGINFGKAFFIGFDLSKLINLMKRNLIHHYSLVVRRDFEDATLSNASYYRQLDDRFAITLRINRVRSVLRIPPYVLNAGIFPSAFWLVRDVASILYKRARSPRFLIEDVPFLVLTGMALLDSPMAALFSLIPYVLSYVAADEYTIASRLISIGGDEEARPQTPDVETPRVFLEPSPSDIAPYTEDDDSDTDIFFTDMQVVESPHPARGGLSGAGYRFSVISFVARHICKFIKMLSQRGFFSLAMSYVVGSAVDSLVLSKWSSRFSRVCGFSVVFMFPRGVLLPVAAEAISRHSALKGLRRFLPSIRMTSSVFDGLFYSRKLSFAKIPDRAPAFLPVLSTTPVSTRVAPAGARDVIENAEKLLLFKQSVRAAIKSARSCGGADSDSETSSTDVSSDASSVSSESPPTPAETDASPEKTQLLQIISERDFDSGRRCAGSGVSGRPAHTTGLCKYLVSLNFCSTTPVPYIQVVSLGTNFARCSNAIREFYFLQEVSLFELHSKFLQYWGQLECSSFQRSLAECDMDEDLYVYNSSEHKYLSKAKTRVPNNLKSYEMMFTRDGMVLNDPTHKHDKLMHEQMAFVAPNAFLRGCEHHGSLTFNNADLSVKLYEAPPGGGKTTALIDLYKEHSKNHSCLIVTANKNSQVDIKKKVLALLSKGKTKVVQGSPKVKGMSGKEVMTIDSYLMNSFGTRCNILFIDECFMVHAGQVLAIINATQCKRCILFGDSRQIHYIQRNETCAAFYGDLDLFIPPEARVYGNVSYRCPWDVCRWLTRVYRNEIASANEPSVGKSSVSIVEIESLESVPFLSGVKYVTYTQGEKSELQRYLFKTFPKIEVNTVHEVQGETFSRVALVRTKYQEDTPFVSENHIIVALSRHVESLHYYVLSSRSFDDTSRAIKEMLDIAEQYKTVPRYFSGSDIQMEVVGEPVDSSSCKALSAPLQSLNDFLEEVVPGSTSISFGDPSAEMSTSPFESGVDHVTIRSGDNGSRLNDHDPARV